MHACAHLFHFRLNENKKSGSEFGLFSYNATYSMYNDYEKYSNMQFNCFVDKS